MDPHIEDKTVSRPSYLNMGITIPYLGNAVFIWDATQGCRHEFPQTFNPYLSEFIWGNMKEFSMTSSQKIISPPRGLNMRVFYTFNMQEMPFLTSRCVASYGDSQAHWESKLSVMQWDNEHNSILTVTSMAINYFAPGPEYSYSIKSYNMPADIFFHTLPGHSALAQLIWDMGMNHWLLL